MRIGGLLLTALGVLMTITRVASLIVRFHDLSRDDLTRSVVAILFSFLVLVGGLEMLQISRTKSGG